MISVKKIFNVKSDKEFNLAALEIFKHQAYHNKVYKQFLEINKTNIEKINSIKDIPFLPIGFFKTYKIITGDDAPQEIFYSSGTTQQIRSKHYITDPELYKTSFQKSFNLIYGNPANYCFLALLPSYLEIKNSSLVYMMKNFIDKSKYNESGFYSNNYKELYEKLIKIKQKKIPVILFGVSFALLEFCERYSIDIKEIIVMETGGMKGQREQYSF